MKVKNLIKDLQNVDGELDILDSEGFAVFGVEIISSEEGNKEWNLKPNEEVVRIRSSR